MKGSIVVIALSTISLRVLWFHLTVLHGQSPPALVSVVLVSVAIVVPAWAIGHAVGTPSENFTTIGRSKFRWIGWMVALFLLGDFLSLLVAIYYLIRVRPQLRKLLVSNSGQ